MTENYSFYFFTFLLAFILSIILVPVIRKLAIYFNFYDAPTSLKNHKGNIPVIGGIGVFLSFSLTLIFMRFYTSYPTGTLKDLRYILIGSFFMLLLGLFDDLKKPKGLSIGFKFLVQFIIAIFMVFLGFKINFLKPDYLSFILSVLWIVGISNAFNLIDIMDGLAGTQIVIIGLAFLFISLPSEYIYVNFLAASLSASALGFLPYNFSDKKKIFLGDGGSLFAGFVLSILSLGSEYSHINPLGVYVPLFILSLPICDTLFVSFIRIRNGISPFKGTKDHLPLRLEKIGFSRKVIVLMSVLFSSGISFLAYFLTRFSFYYSIFIYSLIFIVFIYLLRFLSKIKMD